jgi:apolipoprotein N-acyltransferase
MATGLERAIDDRPDAALRVLAVQPNLPGSARWDPASQPLHADRIGRFSRQALDEQAPRPDLLLWPENAVTWGPDSGDPRRLVADWAARLDVALIAGLAVRDTSRPAPGYRNLLVWFDRDGRILDSVDKQITVPGLERLPIDAWWRAPIQALLGRAAAGPKVAGRVEMRSLRGDGTISQVLCFEALFPGLVARRRTSATVLLLNPSDDRWAGMPRVSRQLARYASFRAIEQHLPLVRVSHAGGTALYDPQGRERETLPAESFGALAFAVDRPASLRAARAAVASALLGGVVAGLVSRFILLRDPYCGLDQPGRTRARSDRAREPDAAGDSADRGRCA